MRLLKNEAPLAPLNSKEGSRKDAKSRKERQDFSTLGSSVVIAEHYFYQASTHLNWRLPVSYRFHLSA
jgi:hypothetical protein